MPEPIDALPEQRPAGVAVLRVEAAHHVPERDKPRWHTRVQEIHGAGIDVKSSTEEVIVRGSLELLVLKATVLADDLPLNPHQFCRPQLVGTENAEVDITVATAQEFFESRELLN